MPLQHVDPDPKAGFHYPYLLNIPAPSPGGESRLLVEGTNIPGPADDFDAHLEEATRRAEQGFGRGVADELGAPFLHPVFPRPRTHPVDWTHYTHQLCRKTLQLESAPLARIDEQLLAMIDDARTRILRHGWSVSEDVMVNGFSASGTFAHRFSVLHPDRVSSVTAGGINGMVVLPREAASVDALGGRRPLNYPVGVADLEALTGAAFDLDRYRTVDQFLFMGAEDGTDTLRYPDAWTQPEIRASAILVYGEDPHQDRFPYCRQVYNDHDIPSVFRRYEDTGHTPDPAFDDVVAFHEQSAANVDAATLEATFGGNVGQ